MKDIVGTISTNSTEIKLFMIYIYELYVLIIDVYR